MKIKYGNPRRKAIRVMRPVFGPDDATTLATRYVLRRFDVSPSLAGAIAELAMLGGCR